MSTAADRMRRHRERLALKKAVLRPEVELEALADALVRTGFLAPEKRTERGAITAGLERVIAIWARHVTCHFSPLDP